MTEPVDPILRATYDGRQETTKVIGRIMEHIAVSQVSENYRGWYRLLLSMYALTRDYMAKGKSDEIKEQLDKVDNKLAIYSTRPSFVVSTSLDRALNQVTCDLYGAIKHLLLPSVTESGNDIFDIATFRSGSDM